MKAEKMKQIYEYIRVQRRPVYVFEIRNEFQVSQVTTKRWIEEMERMGKIRLAGIFYDINNQSNLGYDIVDPNDKYAITEFDVADFINKPIWDNVWKEWVILYKHPDYKTLYLQRINNESLEFTFIKNRYYTEPFEE